MIAINWYAILGSAVASMILGTLWYGPLFGKTWMKLSGITKGNGGKDSGMGKSYAMMFIGSMIMAYVLANGIGLVSMHLGMSGVMSGMQVGFWSWLGFIAPATIGMVLWERKPWKLWFIVSGYYLVLLLIMGTILSMYM